MASLARIGNKLFLRNGLPVRAPAAGAVDFGCCCPYVSFAIGVNWGSEPEGMANTAHANVTTGIGSAREASATSSGTNEHSLTIVGPCGTSTVTSSTETTNTPPWWGQPTGYSYEDAGCQGTVYERKTTFSAFIGSHTSSELHSFFTFEYHGPGNGYAIVACGGRTKRIDSTDPTFAESETSMSSLSGSIEIHLQ